MKNIFETAFQDSPVAQVVIDRLGKIRLVNLSLCEVFEYEQAELVDEAIEILVPDMVKVAHPRLVEGFFQSPTQRKMGFGRELFGQSKSGRLIPIEVGLQPISGESEPLVLAGIIDITARIGAERLFRAAVEAAPNAMVMVDEERKIRIISHQAEVMFGYTREELIGQPIEILVPSDTRSAHPGFVKQFFEHPEPRSMGMGRDLFAERKDKSSFPVEVGLQPVETVDGKFVISSIVDISERVSDKAKLLRRNEELQHFAYRTSHDLKAPLTSIQSLAGFLEKDIRNGNYQESLDVAKRISKVSARLRKLLLDILELTKSDYFEDNFVATDLNEIVDINLDKLQEILEEKGVQVFREIHLDQTIYSVPIRLESIFYNLISNAAKYSDERKPERWIKIQAKAIGKQVQIRFEDNGLRIPEERHKEVFGMFKRFHTESAAGSGLGLYLVKQHVDQLNGKIAFESTAEGTAFMIEIPLEGASG